ncbi:leucine-rich repeat domain-containing protein [Ruminococcus sp. CLA-AA-H200]|uniref:Leucine-rich repeat domain-containing protein n=1 Tax=Ruminococcus turbiniformis TaxID=2881258 RepID=A0ABS8G1Z8_9FIRM|nr:leucine-rich repeat domain-containing protein [Ruminococcus turbiniformis]MCC2255442.1 leucine-rich repeat domain-containing protein [Ruminococcus turbiniformis]
MKIAYREREDGIEIVRLWGTDGNIVVPDQIGGKPVVRADAYAFSGRNDSGNGNGNLSGNGSGNPGRNPGEKSGSSAGPESGVLMWESSDNRMFESGERLLAGDAVESVRFPDSMEEIGRYVFYGCRNLRKLSFSDRLTGIGSGAFTRCRSLSELDVRLNQGSRTCVPDILGDLWQRIDVTFRKGEREIRLVFPEHYEEAVENTPARILFTQHHGSGNNYRQCFYNKEMDYRKYDSLFYSARAQDRVDVIADIIFARLLYPEDLTESAEEEYESYIRSNGAQVAGYLTDTENMKALREMSGRGLWNAETMDQAVDYASKTGRREVLAFLMNEKQRLFPSGRKKYEL